MERTEARESRIMTLTRDPDIRSLEPNDSNIRKAPYDAAAANPDAVS